MTKPSYFLLATLLILASVNKLADTVKCPDEEPPPKVDFEDIGNPHCPLPAVQVPDEKGINQNIPCPSPPSGGNELIYSSYEDDFPEVQCKKCHLKLATNTQAVVVKCYHCVDLSNMDIPKNPEFRKLYVF